MEPWVGWNIEGVRLFAFGLMTLVCCFCCFATCFGGGARAGAKAFSGGVRAGARGDDGAAVEEEASSASAGSDSGETSFDVTYASSTADTSS